MSPSVILFLIVGLGLFSWFTATGRAKKKSVGSSRLPALPHYYGLWAVLWTVVPALFLVLIWVLLEQSVIRSIVVADIPTSYLTGVNSDPSLIFSMIKNHVQEGVISESLAVELVPAAETYVYLAGAANSALFGAVALIGVAGLLFSVVKFSSKLHARVSVEKWIRGFLFLSSLIAILTTLGILLSVIFESMRFFQMVSPMEFLFGTHWSPQVALRADQTASSGSFGAVPLFAGTLLIAAIAMTVALPVGLYSAIFLSEYATTRVRNILKPVLEVLAGIPTVVYGFFAALTVAPNVRNFVEWLSEKLISMGLMDTPFEISSESALAAGAVMGIMLIPFISSMADDVIRAVPTSLRDGSLGLGATRSETITKVTLPAALPGVVGGIMLAISRAIGETMIVVMAAGLSAKMTANPFESVTTVTVQIATLLVGDQEFDSPKTLAAFALGLVLFVVTLILNMIALHVVNKYREQYD
ncbi:phosphate ABC transporter permease subunit PstC [Umboniibacter marinipuniceus]|uniref:Phosphate transport system permease protein n=1 Tax=Umboniibacter marinipuniceus TaxID=569599 RepID=A0A3M0AAD1_9GAMM|nr:phosphate ABC transporter permease subunit PstC [Umboniibacter marinipuniceus]RMA82103.1 phosphate ABC transporter membrane protein 1 (PhoT family) [Umboniibacter marinipuniceus]